MPGMSGVELADVIRALAREIAERMMVIVEGLTPDFRRSGKRRALPCDVCLRRATLSDRLK
jgi:hypothetical protein